MASFQDDAVTKRVNLVKGLVTDSTNLSIILTSSLSNAIISNSHRANTEKTDHNGAPWSTGAARGY